MTRSVPRAGLAVLFALAAVAGCTTAPERQERPAAGDPVLERLATTLPGDYATSTPDATAILLLTVNTEPLVRQNPLIFNLTQQQTGQPARQFVLAMGRSGQDNGYAGFFAPMDLNGQPIRRCQLDITIRSSGLSARTAPETCRFGEGQTAVGLIKEFAFDGSQLVIADRLVGPDQQTPAAPDQIHTFHRIARFTGWAGIQEGESWRLTRSIELDSANGHIEPLDAAGMALGFDIRLSRQRIDRMDTPILRLSVHDPETGKTLGQSWADPDARSIGIALPDLQVGLTRIE